MNNLAKQEAVLDTIKELSRELRQRIATASEVPQGIVQNQIDPQLKTAQRHKLTNDCTTA